MQEDAAPAHRNKPLHVLEGLSGHPNAGNVQQPEKAARLWEKSLHNGQMLPPELPFPIESLPAVAPAVPAVAAADPAAAGVGHAAAVAGADAVPAVPAVPAAREPGGAAAAADAVGADAAPALVVGAVGAAVGALPLLGAHHVPQALFVGDEAPVPVIPARAGAGGRRGVVAVRAVAGQQLAPRQLLSLGARNGVHGRVGLVAKGLGLGEPGSTAWRTMMGSWPRRTRVTKRLALRRLMTVMNN